MAANTYIILISVPGEKAIFFHEKNDFLFYYYIGHY